MASSLTYSIAGIYFQTRYSRWLFSTGIEMHSLLSALVYSFCSFSSTSRLLIDWHYRTTQVVYCLVSVNILAKYGSMSPCFGTFNAVLLASKDYLEKTQAWFHLPKDWMNSTLEIPWNCRQSLCVRYQVSWFRQLISLGI